MRRGRPPQGIGHVDQVPTSDETKRRLKLILETLSGAKSVAEVCAALGVSEGHFHRLREAALAGAAAALEPRPAGRPVTAAAATASRVAELEAEVVELKLDLRAAQIREELAVVLPGVLLPRGGEAAKKKGGGRPVGG